MSAIAQFTALNLPIVAGVAAASAGLHIAILAAHSGGTIGTGPRAALYGGAGVYLLASALLPSTKLSRARRLARLASALAAMGLIFMGAIVVRVYLVPALTGVLAAGLVAEGHAASRRRLAGYREAVTEMIPPAVGRLNVRGAAQPSCPVHVGSHGLPVLRDPGINEGCRP